MANQQPNESVRIFINKRATRFIIAVEIIFALLLTIVIIFTTRSFINQRYESTLRMLIAISSVTGLYLLFVYQVLNIINYFLRYFQTKPELIIRSDGLEFYRYGLILWSDIKSIALRFHFRPKKIPRKSIAIYLKDKKSILHRQTWPNRLLIWIWGKIWVYPYLSTPIHELYELLQKHLSKKAEFQK